MAGPLEGIRVLEFTQIIAGPFACQNLADMGAEVIKVEPPEGEPWRLFSQFMPGESKTYQSLNRGKRSLVLSLQTPEAQAIVHRMVPNIDVVVINYRPDVPAKLGIDYETLRALKPDLIYVDNTAFGRKGPRAQSPGYDIIAQAISGLMVGEGKADPVTGTPKIISSTAIADYGTGLAIAWGVCAALYHREKTGEGQMIESTLLQTALAFQGGVVFELPAADELRNQRMARVHHLQESGAKYSDLLVAHNPLAILGAGNIYYRAYSTQDGAIAIGALSPTLWAKVRTALDTDFMGIADPGYDPTNAEWAATAAVRLAEVEEHVRSRPTAEWEDIFTANGVPNGPLNFPEDMANDPQVLANGGIVELEHDLSGPQRQVGPVLQMSATPLRAQGAAPPLGRDTDAVLTEVGYTAEEIVAFRTGGAIA
ncbi:MAG: CoA transferase [Chloroflexi bacterium]|nr:CoA transferase [Chloroflexota bacterium]MDA1146971.1 CoA transferase [Chloroflexota bacterium]